MDDAEVYQHALRNRDALREQIVSTAPQLAIVCGAVVFRALHDMEFLGDGVTSGKKWQIQEAGDGRRVIEASHPSPRNPDWRNYESIYNQFETIHRQII